MRGNAKSVQHRPLFLLFLQEIISDRPLASRRNPGIPAAQQIKKQRDTQRITD